MLETKGNLKFVLIEVFVFLIGLLIFSSFPHNNVHFIVCSIIGLFIMILIIGRKIQSWKDFQYFFDIYLPSRSSIYYLLIGSLVGLFFALVYRDYSKINLWPAKLNYFAIVAPLVGATEELIFRGFLQKRVRQIGIASSIIIASLFHTVYKSVFFFSRHSYGEINLFYLIKWTLIVGIIFGILKEFAKNSLPPICGHAIFDLVAYGDRPMSMAPWWIWT